MLCCCGLRLGSQTLPSGHLPTSILLEWGDVAFFNSQIWHRGSQNHSDVVRKVIMITYGCRFIAQRFYPFLNYRMPDQVIRGASDTLMRILGKHSKGPYG